MNAYTYRSDSLKKSILSPAEQEKLFSSGAFDNLEKILRNSKIPATDEESIISDSCIARYYYQKGQYILSDLLMPDLEDSTRFSKRCQFYVFFSHAQKAYEIQNDLNLALKLYLEAEKIAKGINNDNNIRQMKMAVTWRLGTIYAYKGDYTLAEKYFQNSLYIVNGLNSYLGYAVWELSQAWYFFYLEKYKESLDIILKVLFNLDDMSRLEYLKSEFLYVMVLNELKLNCNPNYIYLIKTLEVIKYNLFRLGRGHIYIPYLGVLDPSEHYNNLVLAQGYVYNNDSKYNTVCELIEKCGIKPECSICKCNNVKELTVDHIIPRVYGGSNSIDNLRILCRKCNSSKKDKILILDPDAYERLKRRLLV